MPLCDWWWMSCETPALRAARGEHPPHKNKVKPMAPDQPRPVRIYTTHARKTGSPHPLLLPGPPTQGAPTSCHPLLLPGPPTQGPRHSHHPLSHRCRATCCRQADTNNGKPPMRIRHAAACRRLRPSQLQPATATSARAAPGAPPHAGWRAPCLPHSRLPRAPCCRLAPSGALPPDSQQLDALGGGPLPALRRLHGAVLRLALCRQQ